MGRIVTHKNANIIWLYDYNQFSELSDCRDKILCLSDRDINLIWNAIQNIWTIQSRVYINADGTQYEIVDNEQWEEFVNWVATMRNNLGEWPVCNDILQSIADSLDTIANKPCCPTGATTGSRGSGSTEQPPNPYDQGETPETPPPGFSDMEVFNSHKCDAAEDLINALKADLIGLSGLIYSGATPTGLVGTVIIFLLTPIPFDDLIALMAYLIYSAYSYTFLAEMSAKIGENQDDLRCVLYSSNSSQTAQTDFLAALEEIALDYFTTTDDAEWVMGAIEYMLQYDAFNVLFENIPTISNGAACDCGEECTPLTSGLTIDFGSGGHIGAGVWEIEAVFASGWPCGSSAREIAVYNIPDGFILTGYEVISGSVVACGTPPYHSFEGLGSPYSGTEGTSETGFGLPQSLGSLYVLSNTDFTIQLTLCQLAP